MERVYVITETATYEVQAESAEAAEELFLSLDDTDDVFTGVTERTVDERR